MPLDYLLLDDGQRFSALQRAEIAEILPQFRRCRCRNSFSALQRAEIAEMGTTPALQLR